MKNLLLLAAIILFAVTQLHAAEKLYIYSAASMTGAVKNIIQAFETAHPHSDLIRVSFAASSTLARQIAAGAPANVFISANRRWVNWLDNQGLIKKETITLFASNELVLISAIDSRQYTDSSQLKPLLKDKFLALGNYNHTPVGMYTKQSFESLKLWNSWKPRLVLFPDVIKALNSVSMKQSDYGVVYRTDAALLENIHINYHFPADSHRPIIYPAALVSGNPNKNAEVFLSFLSSEPAVKILKDFGFVTLK
jgi:molybdate transport system substrate-binding protein